MERIIDEEYGIFEPIIKGMRKGAAALGKCSELRMFNRQSESNPSAKRVSKKRAARNRHSNKELNRQLAEENRIGMEVLMEEYKNYEERRVQEECDEMFKQYNSQYPQFELILDLVPASDEEAE